MPEADIHDYQSFERLADNPRVQAVYIVLPNGMHKEFTLRAAKIGKHVLCEKPMANSVADCQAMVDAMKRADRKLMIAYRSQYEPMDRMIAKMVKDSQLGPLREFIAGNSQNVGDPAQWRLNKALAGGGALPDIGLYCLNAARFLSGEEPQEVIAIVYRPESDPRFVEVEASVHFILRFPSGLTATCVSSYASHESRFFRLQGAQGWAEMDPAFGYNGLRLRHGTLRDGKSAITEVQIDPQNQFAREIDHMSVCVKDDIVPHTPGEEGLQDQRIIEAIYESARTGRAIRLAAPAVPTRGFDPQMECSEKFCDSREHPIWTIGQFLGRHGHCVDISAKKRLYPLPVGIASEGDDSCALPATADGSGSTATLKRPCSASLSSHKPDSCQARDVNRRASSVRLAWGRPAPGRQRQFNAGRSVHVTGRGSPRVERVPARCRFCAKGSRVHSARL
ncbi:hypothetical protein CBA19CS42_30185 [Caballeronia novacaledonica]|uniref:Oxidoreductase domain-containing protein n=1 Tax=Caballeronia novacaledonica TaxID=1544861 RepID=A0AA37MIQ2_9BURK|nr:hypothetical protein CBA19CS42_30185 [Caballeronia novacaledonica]